MRCSSLKPRQFAENSDRFLEKHIRQHYLEEPDACLLLREVAVVVILRRLASRDVTPCQELIRPLFQKPYEAPLFGWLSRLYKLFRHYFSSLEFRQILRRLFPFAPVVGSKLFKVWEKVWISLVCLTQLSRKTSQYLFARASWYSDHERGECNVRCIRSRTVFPRYQGRIAIRRVA